MYTQQNIGYCLLLNWTYIIVSHTQPLKPPSYNGI